MIESKAIAVAALTASATQGGQLAPLTRTGFGRLSTAQLAAGASADAERAANGPAEGEDYEADAAPALLESTTLAAPSAPSAFDDDGAPMPDDVMAGAEAAFLAGERDRPDVAPAAPRTLREAALAAERAQAEHEDSPAARKKLPPVDTLVARLPASVRDTMEELFRAKWVHTRVFPKKHLKQP